MFGDTPEGAAVRRSFTALIETAKANTLDTYTYLSTQFGNCQPLELLMGRSSAVLEDENGVACLNEKQHGWGI